jgi:5-methylcytosine-specific restriction endonuclease McrA
MELTPSQTTNLMRRGLRLLFDPEPSPEEKLRIFDFFQGRCAYCDEEVAGKHDFDHLVSSAKGGANHVSNRVLSCKPCNAKHKRETDWQEFLCVKWKYDPAKLAVLRSRIEQ